MKIITLIALLLISFGYSAQTVATQNQEWIVSSSSVKFKIKNAGFTIDGTFNGLVAKIIFDASKGSGNFINAAIDSKSINTGNETRDSHLKKAEYFDVLKFPSITMKTTVLVKETDGTYKGYFKLTMKGKTKDVLIPFTFSEKNGKALLKGTFTINRLDYAVGESSMLLSDSVYITIEVNAVKK
jgi:polyisoprenoid-binding protein YceI